MVDGIETGLPTEQADDILDVAGLAEGEPPVVEEAEPETAPEPSEDPRILALTKQVEMLTTLVGQSRAPEAAPEPEPAAEEPPDPQSTSPSEYVNWYAQRAVQSAVAPLLAKIEALQQGFTPIQQQREFVNAYHRAASEAGIDAKAMAGSVGALLERDPDIADLAGADPERAARLAIRMAQLEAKASKPAATPKPPAKRPAARPVSAASPSRVATTVPTTFGAAFQQSLQERGVEPGSAFQFTNTWGEGPAAEG